MIGQSVSSGAGFDRLDGVLHLVESSIDWTECFIWWRVRSVGQSLSSGGEFDRLDRVFHQVENLIK